MTVTRDPRRAPRHGRPARVAAALAAALVGLGAGGGDGAGAGAGESAAAADASRGSAPEGCAEALARRVQRRYEDIRDLEADFEQTTRSVTLGSSPLADEGPVRGHVVFAKPGRMRWSYREPEPSLMVSDGEELWLYDPGAGEASRLPVDRGALSGAALQFLIGEGKLLESFRVEPGAEGCAPGEDGLVELVLEPREEARFRRMVLRVDPEQGEVRGTAVEDVFGNVTRVSFSDLRVNRDPSDEVFEFEPPEETTVVDLLTTP